MSVEVSQYQRNIGSIHTHTSFSGTKFTPYQVAVLAQRKSLNVLIYTDYSDREWRYHWGIKLSRASILSRGIENYLSTISDVERKFEGMTILAGVEASPFYYWDGNPFKLSCREYNRHILLFGLKTQDDYEDMPLLGNHKSGFSPFCGGQGITPYQQLIDYANKKGALSFWAHPEQEDNTKFFIARLYTQARPEILKETDGYTGFSAFPRGGEIVPQPGGIWDQILNEYCEGERVKPIWTIGESDFRKEEDDIDNPTTVFVGQINNKKDVLTALREGRIYALDSLDKELFLNKFYVVDEKTKSFASIGQTLCCSANQVTIHIDIESKVALKSVVLIKDGIIIKESKETNFEYIDNHCPPQKKSFYRLIIESSNGNRLLTNPIFVLPLRDL